MNVDYYESQTLRKYTDLELMGISIISYMPKSTCLASQFVLVLRSSIKVRLHAFGCIATNETISCRQLC